MLTIQLSEDAQKLPASEQEQELDLAIQEFDRFMVGQNQEPLAQPERAIIKTFLTYWIKRRGQNG